MCAELGASVLIDDSLVYARQCAQTMDHVFLFDFHKGPPVLG